MPSPFPGMDPWLELPEIFPDLHDGFIAELRKTLTKLLPVPYYAALNNRVWVDLSLRFIGPDVDVLYPPARSKKTSTGKKPKMVAMIASEPLVIDAPWEITNDDMHESFLEIFTRRGKEQLVTSVELLSMSNKKEGDRGRELYQKKQAEIRASKVNLVEIDLLRGGIHTTQVYRPLVEEQYGRFDYHVCIQRMDQKDKFYVYPWPLEAHLPTIEIPLVPGDPLVKIDLQSILDEAYNAAGYERRVHYRIIKPTPPLTREQKKWADAILKAKGI